LTTEEKRAAIARVYPTKSWQRKVANMEENQVIAIYLSFEKNGNFRRGPKKYNKPFIGKNEPQQLSIYDFIDEKGEKVK
jgi:hypothetical protein